LTPIKAASSRDAIFEPADRQGSLPVLGPAATGSFTTSSGTKSLYSFNEEHRNMPVKLNRSGYNHATKLIEDGHAVLDERDDWSEHQPSAREKNSFIEEHGFREYRKWHLGIDDAQGENTKRRYKFPYGDFKNVHRCAVLAAESRAGQYKYLDIELAAAHLHGILEALEKVGQPRK